MAGRLPKTLLLVALLGAGDRRAANAGSSGGVNILMVMTPKQRFPGHPAVSGNPLFPHLLLLLQSQPCLGPAADRRRPHTSTAYH